MAAGCPESMRVMSGSGPFAPTFHGVWQSLQPPSGREQVGAALRQRLAAGRRRRFGGRGAIALAGATGRCGGAGRRPQGPARQGHAPPASATTVQRPGFDSCSSCRPLRAPRLPRGAARVFLVTCRRGVRRSLASSDGFSGPGRPGPSRSRPRRGPRRSRDGSARSPSSSGRLRCPAAASAPGPRAVRHPDEEGAALRPARAHPHVVPVERRSVPGGSAARPRSRSPRPAVACRDVQRQPEQGRGPLALWHIAQLGVEIAEDRFALSRCERGRGGGGLRGGRAGSPRTSPRATSVRRSASPARAGSACRGVRGGRDRAAAAP